MYGAGSNYGDTYRADLSIFSKIFYFRSYCRCGKGLMAKTSFRAVKTEQLREINSLRGLIINKKQEDILMRRTTVSYTHLGSRLYLHEPFYSAF